MLEVAGLHAHYGNIEALHGVSIEVDRGEIVTIIGANGAGKSTLLMTICGRPKPSAGEIVFESQRLNELEPHEIVARGIAQAPRAAHLPGHERAREPADGRGADERRVLRSGHRARLALFPRLKERQHQRGGTLSGGEQQMLCIGRAHGAPAPASPGRALVGLAPMLVKQIFEAIVEINRERGLTILLVEQNAYQALKIANRGYVLATGRVVLEGTGAELLSDPEIRAAYLEGGH